MESIFDPAKMFTYLKGYINGKGWTQSQQALIFARRLHDGQERRGGGPYIAHPLTMACHATAIGIDDDRIIAAILLHDVVEDCGVKAEDIPVSDEVRHIVELLSYKKPENKEDEPAAKQAYYDAIAENPYASMAKLFDRCHNVSTMGGVFSRNKTLSYIAETETYVIPLMRIVKERYPEYQSQLFDLKYHTYSLLLSLKGVIDKLEHTQA